MREGHVREAGLWKLVSLLVTHECIRLHVACVGQRGPVVLSWREQEDCG